MVLGQREYKTEPANVDGGKTPPWNSDFALYGSPNNYEQTLDFGFCVGFLLPFNYCYVMGWNIAVPSTFYDCPEFLQVSGSPVTNLRDKLIVAVCNNEDQSVTQTGKLNHSFSLFISILCYQIGLLTSKGNVRFCPGTLEWDFVHLLCTEKLRQLFCILFVLCSY